MQASYKDDPGLLDAVFDLLDVVFPGLRGAEVETRTLGGRWEDASTPFLHVEAGRPIAHVGIIELPLVIQGRPVTVGSVHAVAVHPDHRGRGHCRALMTEALRYAEGRLETLVLTTGEPPIYERYGFRVLQEHQASVRADSDPAPAGALRLLDLGREADLRILHRLLEAREPVSRVVGCRDAATVFLFSEGSRPLYYAEGLDAVLCMEQRGTTLTLADVVSPRVPTLEAILSVVPHRVESVIMNFTPDRVAPGAATTPRLQDPGGPDYLMARGPFAAEIEPFMLPRTART